MTSTNFPYLKFDADRGYWNMKVAQIETPPSTLESRVPFDSRRVRGLCFYAKSEESLIGSVQWTNDAGEVTSKDFLIRNRDGWHDYTIDLTDNPTWSGRITKTEVMYKPIDVIEGKPLKMTPPVFLKYEFVPECGQALRSPGCIRCFAGRLASKCRRCLENTTQTLLPIATYKLECTGDAALDVQSMKGDWRKQSISRNASVLTYSKCRWMHSEPGSRSRICRERRI